MRTFRYAKEFPDGRIFDTEHGMPDPHLPSDWKSRGWVEHFGELKLTTEQIVEASVRQELAKQSSDRVALEKEYEKKTGEKASSLISDEAMVRAYNAPAQNKKR